MRIKEEKVVKLVENPAKYPKKLEDVVDLKSMILIQKYVGGVERG
jgi:hypothetical protein